MRRPPEQFKKDLESPEEKWRRQEEGAERGEEKTPEKIDSQEAAEAKASEKRFHDEVSSIEAETSASIAELLYTDVADSMDGGFTPELAKTFAFVASLDDETCASQKMQDTREMAREATRGEEQTDTSVRI